MYHLVYLTKNLVNGKIYVGVHSTYKLNDGYLGSGLAIKAAVKKYGKNNFQRIVLHECLNREDCMVWEKHIVDLPFINRTDTYNEKLGGSLNPNPSNQCGRIPWNKGIPQTEERKLLQSKLLKGRPLWSEEEKQKRGNFLRTVQISKHSEKSKALMSDKAKGRTPWNKGRSGLQTAWNKGKVGYLKGKEKEQVTCPYCGKTGGKPTMSRWHFENCKKFQNG